MKKIGIICFMAIVAMLGLNSCGGGSGTEAQDQAIAYKIDNGEDLTSEDYSRMINYVGEFAKKAQDLVTQTGGTGGTQLADLQKEYPFLDTFRDCIKTTSMKNLDEKNKEEINKYAGLTEFSTPPDYTVNTDPEAAGMEVSTPDSDNGVIAGAVDTLKVKE